MLTKPDIIPSAAVFFFTSIYSRSLRGQLRKLGAQETYVTESGGASVPPSPSGSSFRTH